MPTETQPATEAIEAAVNYRFRDPDLVSRALTHASIAEQRLQSNERMEFLGDSVLGLIVAERIYQRYPHLLEGEMTKIKSTAVSRQTCATIARRLGLDRWLVLGKGMQRENGMPQSLSAAVLESVIAAIYLDGGYAAAEAFVAPLFEPLIDVAARSGHQENFKSVLQQHAQQAGLEPPGYRVLDEKGPDHAKAFKVAAEIGSRRFTPTWGNSKKQAEQAAALVALEELGLVEKTPEGLIRLVNGRDETEPKAAPGAPAVPATAAAASANKAGAKKRKPAGKKKAKPKPAPREVSGARKARKTARVAK
ncbi:MAG: ribonuclease III [Phycisphaerales bacterium]